MKKYITSPIGAFDASGRQFPGSFQIDTVTLKTRTGDVNISEDVVEILIDESLDNCFLSGHIIVQDIKNLIVKHAIMGDEAVQIVIKDGVFQTDVTFRCYALRDRNKTSQTVEIFKLAFCSEDLFVSQFNKVQKSYMNELAEDVIEDLFLEATGLFDRDKFHFEDTRHPLCCIIPGWDLARACKFIAGRSVSETEKYHSNHYQFFQTLDGVYNFWSLDALMDETRNVVASRAYFDPLRRKDQVAHDPNQEARVVAFEDLRIASALDHIVNINSGMYANRVPVISLSSREVVENEYNYIDEFEDSVHMKGPRSMGQVSLPLIPQGSPMREAYGSVIMPVITTKGLYTDELPDSKTWETEIYHKKRSRNSQVENFLLEGTMPGHLGLMVGQLIDVEIPYRPWPYSGSATSVSLLDPILSGQYLIKRLVRRFAQNNSEFKVLLMKDSISLPLAPLPAA